MSDFIQSLIPVYDNGRSKFYLVGEYGDKQNRLGTIQLETVRDMPKMFRVAATHGSGHYYKNLSDALYRARALGWNCPDPENFQAWLEVDRTVQKNWENGIFNHKEKINGK